MSSFTLQPVVSAGAAPSTAFDLINHCEVKASFTQYIGKDVQRKILGLEGVYLHSSAQQVGVVTMKQLQGRSSQESIIHSCEDRQESSSSNILSGYNASSLFYRTGSVESNLSRDSTDSNSSNEPLPGVSCEDWGELGCLLSADSAVSSRTTTSITTTSAVTSAAASSSQLVTTQPASTADSSFEDDDVVSNVPVSVLTLQVEVTDPEALQGMIASLNCVNQIKMFCCQPRLSRSGAALGLFIAAESHIWLINVAALGDMEELWTILGVRPDFKGKQVKLMWDSNLDSMPCHAAHAGQVRAFLGLRNKPAHKKVCHRKLHCKPHLVHLKKRHGHHHHHFGASSKLIKAAWRNSGPLFCHEDKMELLASLTKKQVSIWPLKKEQPITPPKRSLTRPSMPAIEETAEPCSIAKDRGMAAQIKNFLSRAAKALSCTTCDVKY